MREDIIAGLIVLAFGAGGVLAFLGACWFAVRYSGGVG